MVLIHNSPTIKVLKMFLHICNSYYVTCDVFNEYIHKVNIILTYTFWYTDCCIYSFGPVSLFLEPFLLLETLPATKSIIMSMSEILGPMDKGPFRNCQS